MNFEDLSPATQFIIAGLKSGHLLPTDLPDLSKETADELKRYFEALGTEPIEELVKLKRMALAAAIGFTQKRNAQIAEAKRLRKRSTQSGWRGARPGR